MGFMAFRRMGKINGMIIELSQNCKEGHDMRQESKMDFRRRKKYLRFQKRLDKRADRLDRYFSSRPPNGSLLSIYRTILADMRNTKGEPPKWIDYGALLDSFSRLQKRNILTIETTEDKMGAKTFKSESKMKQRNSRPVEIDALIEQLKQDLGETLQQPISPPEQIHGCRQITLDKWRVRLYVGGTMRALGCYPFETALRLQDALTRYFRAYRNGLPRYNTSETQAEEFLGNPAVKVFSVALEKHWLAAGVIQPPCAIIKAPVDWRAAIESRLSAIESHLKISQ